MEARKSSRIFEVGEISGPEVGDSAKPDVPTTDQQNEKKKFSKIFKNFQAMTVTNGFNIILLSLPHWIHHTRIRDENRDFRKSGKPVMKTGRGIPPIM